jgi:hypothetical protein|tara:strand:- start:1028 stop:1174 length:147 start_codon:yes stop_codon:yes gene_type:complete
MIKNIIDLLNASDWYGEHELIEIAKGKYKAVSNYKEMKEQLKRLGYGN